MDKARFRLPAQHTTNCTYIFLDVFSAQIAFVYVILFYLFLNGSGMGFNEELDESLKISMESHVHACV